MDISVDSFLKIGKGHNMCEDYIIQSSSSSAIPHIILSDGCSTAKDTDIGARILARSCRDTLNFSLNSNLSDVDGYEDFGKETIIRAKNYLFSDLDESCLRATLISSFIDKNILKICMYGDGLCITLDNNDNILCRKINFKKNAPYYLSYRLNKIDELNYINSFENVENVKTIDYYKINTNGKSVSTVIKTGLTCISRYSFNIKYYKSVIIASDGLSSFTDTKTRSTINFFDVLKEVCSFKNTYGEFIKRRVKRFINNFEKEDIINLDDIAIGGFFFNRQEKNDI